MIAAQAVFGDVAYYGTFNGPLVGNASTAAVAGASGTATNWSNSQSWGHSIPNTYRAVTTGSPLIWDDFGDSIASLYGGGSGTNGWVIDYLRKLHNLFSGGNSILQNGQYIGNSGDFGNGIPLNFIAAQPFENRMMINPVLTGNCYITNDGNVFFGTSVHAYGAGNFTATWRPNITKNNSGGYFNVLSLDYTASNGYPNFTVWTNVPGTVTMLLAATINADNSGNVGGKVYLAVSNALPDQIFLMVSNATGGLASGQWLDFIGVKELNTTTNGVAFGFHSWGGASLQTFFQCSTNITGPIYKDWSPSLMTINFLDDSNTWAIYGPQLANFQTNFLPKTDIVIVLPQSVTNDTPTGIGGVGGTNGQISVQTSQCRQYGWICLDANSVLGTYAAITNAGLITPGDSPHLNDLGEAVVASVVDSGLGIEFFPLLDYKKTLSVYSGYIFGDSVNGVAHNGNNSQLQIIGQSDPNKVLFFGIDTTTGHGYVFPLWSGVATEPFDIPFGLEVKNGLTMLDSSTITGNGSGLTNIPASSIVQSILTNTVVLSAATGWTNNGTTASPSNYLCCCTAGTAMALKDVNGNQFAVPVLSSSFPMKNGYRLTGTAITAILYQVSNGAF